MKAYKLVLVVLLTVLIVSCEQDKLKFETPHLSLTVNGRGYITEIRDRQGGIDLLPSDQQAPLLSLFVDSTYLLPESMHNTTGENIVQLHYPNGSTAEVLLEKKDDYLRMELVSLEPRNGVEAVVWGPYPTTIDQTIGETVCVVRNDQFALGLQALEINTIEGMPHNGDDAGGGFFIEPLPGQELPDSLKDKIGMQIQVNVNIQGDMPEYVRLYRGSAAVKTPFGSEMRMFSRDRRIPQVLGKGDDIQYVEPVDVDFVGSAIAFFGCPASNTLDIIEQIELEEGLPHPTINGQWIKRIDWIGDPYLLNSGDPLESMEYAKALGFKLIHIGDIFETWGHFGLETRRFPGGAGEIRQTVRKVRDEGISLGVHTLTMFTGTSDPYVSPVPSDSLCKTGSSVLVRDLEEASEVIFVEDPTYFRNLGYTHTVKIGKELINYRAVSDSPPWRLVDCMRGQYGTAKGAHPVGSKVDKLTNNSYRGFYPDIHLQDAYARRLAEVCSVTEIDLMDFDGYGGGSPTGHGAYGAAKFIDLWYKSLDRYRLTCGAGTFHYYWHIYSFMNWGEPWYDALRESQVNYRMENQRYFERNFMPAMLGWFTLNPEFRPEEVEWIQARSAAFDAGYLLRVDESIEKSGFKKELFKLIREWQKAIKADAFGPKQKEAFKNPKNEFHLETRDDGWLLYPLQLNRGFEHTFRMVQTGEPMSSEFVIRNPYERQPVQFYLSVRGGQGYQADIALDFNDYQGVKIEGPLRDGDRIFCDGEHVYLCDAWWNNRRLLSADKIPHLKKGRNTVRITSNCSGKDAPTIELEFKTLGQPEKAPANI